MILSALAVGLTVASLRRESERRPVLHFTLPAPEKTAYGNSFAISPDGRRIAFVGTSGGQDLLWIRELDSLTPRPLPGTEPARFPFWSPDSAFVGFFAGGKLKKIDPAGGVPLTLCDAEDGRGGSWSADGVIVFSPAFRSPLYSVAASGGVPSPLTSFDPARGDFSHRWPSFLPDGRHFLFLAMSPKPDQKGIYVGSLDRKGIRLLCAGDARAQYAAGHLLFVREKTLFAQRLDPRTLALRGEPVPIGEGIAREGDGGFTGYAPFSASSSSNALLYRVVAATRTRLEWFDRTGKPSGELGEPAGYAEPMLFSDEKRLVFSIEDPPLSRFTLDPASENSAVVSPDGQWVAFSSARGGRADLYRKLASGAGGEELLLKSDREKYLDCWTSDGRFLVYETTNAAGKTELWAVPVSDDRRPRPILQTPFNQTHASISPDSRWIAYSSDETGRSEIYVQSFPEPGGKWQVTTAGGDQAQWRRDGRELFYANPDRKIVAVDIRPGPGFEAGVPKPLFQINVPANGLTDLRNQYVPSADGQRFLVTTLVDQGGAVPITLVWNWTAEAKK